ncbi:hypothetical protein OHA72_06025 [Dactylosporangium sp. NBC_01737]|uniref:hypothetical protein n=1 Tax=Dactylosporangium sp. NBC_01737 TaxID=2975959 RepID=UPI002E0E65D0|nr:hypothetical protein OHA72_06025 [Dactylosporangium sp. NBC_01737]
MRTFCAGVAMFDVAMNRLSEHMTGHVQRKRQASELRASRRTLRTAAATRARLQVEVAIDVILLIPDATKKE